MAMARLEASVNWVALSTRWLPGEGVFPKKPQGSCLPRFWALAAGLRASQWEANLLPFRLFSCSGSASGRHRWTPWSASGQGLPGRAPHMTQAKGAVDLLSTVAPGPAALPFSPFPPTFPFSPVDRWAMYVLGAHVLEVPLLSRPPDGAIFCFGEVSGAWSCRHCALGIKEQQHWPSSALI
ncbi:hypothetical protein GQ53DRAFT_290033 [Thozetella sp. PMI_491]|nr:hypothetical protein GQ53DRAFT_290033 [Thozetella sp. PMI_491]